MLNMKAVEIKIDAQCDPVRETHLHSKMLCTSDDIGRNRIDIDKMQTVNWYSNARHCRYVTAVGV